MTRPVASTSSVYGQLDDHERPGYERLVELSRRRTYREDWERTARAYALIRNGVSCEQLVDEHSLYLDPRDYEILTAAIAAGIEI